MILWCCSSIIVPDAEAIVEIMNCVDCEEMAIEVECLITEDDTVSVKLPDALAENEN